MSIQEGAEHLRGRRKVKTASSGQKDDELPREQRISKRDRNIERCQVSERALSGQEGVEWSGSLAAEGGGGA